MERGNGGVWRWSKAPPPKANAAYAEAIPRYLTAYDAIFQAAKSRSEFNFVQALVHHEWNSHIDPFETTRRTFDAAFKITKALTDYSIEVSFALWVYGHIVEASYPYQLIGDMVGIAAGQPHRSRLFKPDEQGNEPSPGRKITQIEEVAKSIGIKSDIKPLRDAWNADLRNAVFHSNYSIVGPQIYLNAANKMVKVAEAMVRVNRAIASFEAFIKILDLHRSLYTTPIEIDVSPAWSTVPGKATVVVRQGYGAIAIYDTVDDAGVKSPVILGRLTANELNLVHDGLFLMPPRDARGQPQS